MRHGARSEPELVLPLLVLMFLIGMIWNRASILPLLTALVYAPLYLLRTGDWRSTIALALILPAMLWAHPVELCPLA